MQVAKIFNNETGESSLVLFAGEIERNIPLTSAFYHYGQNYDDAAAAATVSLLGEGIELAARFACLLQLADDYNIDVEIKLQDSYDSNEVAFNLIEGNMKRGVDYERSEEHCDALTYWDGNNWDSIIFAYDTDPTDVDAELIEVDEASEILAAYERSEFESETDGCKQYYDAQSGLYFDHNPSQKVWWSYEVCRLTGVERDFRKILKLK